jgi:anionic cell wall polymer biosynthesis LytR-Cps2A-Psr (LCP) family protein
LVAVAGLLIIESPTLTRSFSSVIFKPQVGAIQWNGADRITVAMLGLTQRTTEPARTDTLLLMDIDPSHHVIHMLSVPRDLWVDIPGYGYGKLAIPYEIGGARLTAIPSSVILEFPSTTRWRSRFEASFES